MAGGVYWYMSDPKSIKESTTQQSLSLTEQDFNWEGDELIVGGSLNKRFVVGNLFKFNCEVKPRDILNENQVSTTLVCPIRKEGETSDQITESAVFKEENLYIFKERVIKDSENTTFETLFEII